MRRAGWSGFGILLGWLVVLAVPGMSPVWAEEATADGRSDCRYELREGGSVDSAFPGDDVFRPLLADPKQPQFFAAWQAVRTRTERTSANIGSVGFGENFGFYTSRSGCNGWQVGILAGVFSQFNLDAPSSDLINTDFIVGVPLSWRAGNWSSRVRIYHQSSHLGDEFLLGRPGFNRLNLSYEEIEAIVSYDYRWMRLYAGGGHLVHREPVSLDRNRVQWGGELRGAAMRSPVLSGELAGLTMTPILGVDCKSLEELHWTVNSNVVGGVEWSRPGSLRRFRLLVNYYYGYTPYGQFFAQKTESVGAGLYLTF